MSAERLLIVNADDYNTGPARNRGIIEAAKNGIVTSLSVLANRPGLKSALAALDQVPGARIGVHLNLTSGAPLTPSAHSLTGPRGMFLPRPAAWRRAMAGGYIPEDLRREWSAQIEALLSCGVQPDHLDSNNHLHVFPGCARICAELAVRFTIKSVRLPLEPLCAPGLWGRSGLKRIFFALLARRARNLFHARGLRMPERMYGIAFPQPGDIASLKRFLRTLPSGVSELMCHPGYCEPGLHAFSSSAEREHELRALIRADVRTTVEQEAIRLISFSDLC